MTKCEHAKLYNNNPACVREYYDKLCLCSRKNTASHVLEFTNYVYGLIVAGDVLYDYCSDHGTLDVDDTETVFVSLNVFDFQAGYVRYRYQPYCIKTHSNDIDIYVTHILPHIILQATGDCPYPASDFAMVSRILQLIYNPHEKEKT